MAKFSRIDYGGLVRNLKLTAHRILSRSRQKEKNARVKDIISSIRARGFDEIHERYAVEDPGTSWRKFLDLEHWIRNNLYRVEKLELDQSEPRRILDIGCGTGYFLYVCRWYGHEVLGLDVDDVKMYGEMMDLLSLPRIVHRVRRFEPLPNFGRRFDAITAFKICFNDHMGPDTWGREEWSFFLDDAERYLEPDGRIWLELNRQHDGRYMSDELQEFFLERGGIVSGNKVVFDCENPTVN